MLPLVLTGEAGFILVEYPVLETARSFLRPPEHLVEAGGILLGAYRGPHLDVTAATVPMPRDRRTPILFDRRDPGHAQAATSAWRESGGTTTYVGEWHSHISGDAQPSSIDLATWRDVLASNPAALYLFVIVAPRVSRFIEGRDGRLNEIMAEPARGH